MKTMKISIFILVGAILMLILAGCGSNDISQPGSNTKEWPTDKITAIIPFKAGGSADNMARGLIKYWEKEIGVPIIIENREGAATQVGCTMFSKMPADGNTILIGTQLYLSANEVLKDADYSIEDFDILNFQQVDPITITVHKDSPYHTLEDLIEDIKARPGELTWGTIYGGGMHLGGEILKDKIGLDFKTVNYDGGNAFRTALLGKQVDFVIGQANGDLAIKDNCRVLAVASKKRMDIWPDSPTFDEALAPYGIKNFPVLGSARYIAVHSKLKGEHPERYQKLLDTYKKAFDNPEYQEYLKTSGEAAVTDWYGPEESNNMNMEMHKLVTDYKDILKQKQ